MHRIAMTPIKTPRLRRRIASVMLVLWVFVLGAAWANACLLQDRATHSDSSLVATAGPPAVSSGHVGIEPGHAQGQSPGEAACLKVCDDASQGIVQWQPNTGLPDTPMLPPFAVRWSASFAALDARQPVRIEHPARPDLPLRTRYVRLAL